MHSKVIYNQQTKCKYFATNLLKYLHSNSERRLVDLISTRNSFYFINTAYEKNIFTLILSVFII